MWAGRVSPGRAIALVEHLIFVPHSRCRAIRYGGDPRWVGWDAAAEVTASVFDAVMAFASGNKFTDDLRYTRPGGGSPTREPEAFAPTIADFNEAAFMREVVG